MALLYMYRCTYTKFSLSIHPLMDTLNQYHNLAKVNTDSLNKIPNTAGIFALR